MFRDLTMSIGFRVYLCYALLNMPSLLKLCLSMFPQWASRPLEHFLWKDNLNLLRQLRKDPGLQRFFKEQRISEIEAKLEEFYLPDITNICKSCDWELYKCHEPELEDYSQETAPGVVIWSQPGTGESEAVIPMLVAAC